MTSHKILVIDADDASRNYLAIQLRKEGETVFLAPSGKRGLLLAWRNTPDLIIADPLLTDLPGEDLAARLRMDARTAKVPLIALSHSARTARLRAWLDSGFDDYLVKSPQVMPLLRSSIADLLGGGSGLAHTGGLLITFFSAKGGLGTSSLCANISTCIADNKANGRVAVADLVLPMGSLSEIVGYHGKQDIQHFGQKRTPGATTELAKGGLSRPDQWNFSFLAGSADPDVAQRLDVVRITRTIATLKSAYDVVVVDLGRSLSRMSLPLLEQADLIVLTASTDHDAVNLTKVAWEYLKARGVHPSMVYLLMNRASRQEGLTNAEAESQIGLPVRASVPYLGESLTNLQHVPFVRHFPGGAGALSLKKIADELVVTAKSQREED